MNEEQMKNYIFFVCELIKQIIVIIIVLFYTCGYYYSNKVDDKYKIDKDIFSKINVEKNNSQEENECNKIINKQNQAKYNFFDFINEIYEIKNTCNQHEQHGKSNEEGSNMIKPNIRVIQNYTHFFSDANLIFGLLMIIVYLLSQTLIQKDYTHNINNIFSDLAVKILTVMIVVPILLLYLYISVYSIVFFAVNTINTTDKFLKLLFPTLTIICMYSMILLFIGFLYLYESTLKYIYGDVRNRNSLALNIDKAVDIFFNFDAKIIHNKNIAIANTVFMCFGFMLSIGALFYSSIFRDEILRQQFCSPGRLPSYPQFFEVIKQFVCDEKSSLVIKNVTRILLSVFVVLMAFELLPISIAIFALVVVIYLIYKSFSYLMNIEC